MLKKNNFIKLILVHLLTSIQLSLFKLLKPINFINLILYLIRNNTVKPLRLIIQINIDLELLNENTNKGINFCTVASNV